MHSHTRLTLKPHHHEHLMAIGVAERELPADLHVGLHDWTHAKDAWRRMLPRAAEHVIEMKAIGTLAWKQVQEGRKKVAGSQSPVVSVAEQPAAPAIPDEGVRNHVVSEGVRNHDNHEAWLKRIFWVLVILAALMAVGLKAHAQSSVTLKGVAKGSTASNSVTVTPTDANHTGVDVNCVAGCGAGSGAVAIADGTTPANKATVDSGNVHVNCAVGCAGGSTTPADAFATPTTAGIQMIFPALYNGVTWDRWRGDATNGAWVNIKSSVAIGVTGTFWQATQPVSGTFWQATQPVSGTFWQATQPVSGTFWQATQPISCATGATCPTNSTLQSPAAGTYVGSTTPQPSSNSGDANSDCNILSAASTNATSCKGSAGNFYGYEIFNTTTTVYYLRLYNTAAAPTCSSATGFIRSIPIPPAAAAGQVGGAVAYPAYATAYGTGIGFCITGGSSSTDNTNAAVGVFGVVKYK